MGECRFIRDLPEDKRQKIAVILDVCNPPNWRSLIKDVLRHHISLHNDEAYIANFAMETLLPGGSPTSKLLSDLGQRGITVGELANWISTSMNGRTSGLQTVSNILSKFVDLFGSY